VAVVVVVVVVVLLLAVLVAVLVAIWQILFLFCPVVTLSLLALVVPELVTVEAVVVVLLF
jgi:hypothetical protein